MTSSRPAAMNSSLLQHLQPPHTVPVLLICCDLSLPPLLGLGFLCRQMANRVTCLCTTNLQLKASHLCRAMPRPMAGCRTGQCHTITPVASKVSTGSPAAGSPGRSTKQVRAPPQQGRPLPGRAGLRELLLRPQRRCVPSHPRPITAAGSRTRLLRPFCTAGRPPRRLPEASQAAVSPGAGILGSHMPTHTGMQC